MKNKLNGLVKRIQTGTKQLAIAGLASIAFLTVGGCNSNNDSTRYNSSDEWIAEPMQPIMVYGTILDVVESPRLGRRDILIKTNGGILYHVGTRNLNRFSDAVQGAGVMVSGKYGLDCEEDYIFPTFQDENGEYIGDYEFIGGRPGKPGDIYYAGLKGNQRVHDLIHVEDFEVLE